MSLVDDDAPPAAPPHDCEYGWRHVTDRYAEEQVPAVPMDVAVAALDEESRMLGLLARGKSMQEALAACPNLHKVRERERLVDLHRGDLYPCPECRPSLFRRWRAGCMRPNHHSRSCDVCQGEKR